MVTFFFFWVFGSITYLTDAMVAVVLKATWDIHMMLFVDKLPLTEQI